MPFVALRPGLKTKAEKSTCGKAAAIGLLVGIGGILNGIRELFTLSRYPQQGITRLGRVVILFGIGILGFSWLIYTWLGCLKRSSKDFRRLGKSLLIQAKAPKSALPSLLEELEADLKLARSFGEISIGNQWVMGKTGMKISRIRGIFTLDLRRKKRGRKYYFCLVDRERHVQITPMEHYEDMRAAGDYLCALLPGAANGGEGDYLAFRCLSSREWEDFNQSFSLKNKERMEERGRLFAFSASGILPTSHTSWETIAGTLHSLKPGEWMVLTPLICIPMAQWGECACLKCQALGEGRRLTMKIRQGRKSLDYETKLRDEAANLIIELLYCRKIPPELSGFHPLLREVKTSRQCCTLVVDGKKYDSVSLRDVEASLEGVDKGLYRSFLLLFAPGEGKGYLGVVGKVGTAYVILANRGTEKSIHREVCRHREQVYLWLAEYFEYGQLPEMKNWQPLDACQLINSVGG